MCCYIESYQEIYNMTKEFRSKISFRTFGYCLGGLKGSDSSKYTQNHMVIDLLLYKELEPVLQLLPEAFWRYLEAF
jgi:hypothetical protein